MPQTTFIILYSFEILQYINMDIWSTRKHEKIIDTSPLTKLRDPASKPSSTSIKANHPHAPQHKTVLQLPKTMYCYQTHKKPTFKMNPHALYKNQGGEKPNRVSRSPLANQKYLYCPWGLARSKAQKYLK